MTTSQEDPVDATAVGIVGLGLLGRGIAACLLGYGFRVVGYSRQEATREEADNYIKTAIDELIARGGYDPQLRHRWRDHYLATNSYDDLATCELVIESVVEDVEIKGQVFQQIEQVVEPSALIATNTSALPISLLQQRLARPERFLGMHWAEPAYATRFLELIRGEATSDETLRRAEQLGRRVGKDPSIVLKDVPGFIVNRLAYAMYREACHLLETGVADAATIDRSFRNAAGMWAPMCGPLRWIDITGGPALYAKAMAAVVDNLSNATEVPAALQQLADADARGVLNGRGFYQYEPGDQEKWQNKFHGQAWDSLEMMNRHDPISPRDNEDQPCD